eukprot:CAMPEP_0197726202 /NCGR_PEP_ID=MMETSP1434-20131217/14012_1 /TAXON_ID=265543 /ORGANISM="Minutocellus polymorphus, Strain CCMP3303" /LENGTH=384 /DNA_ID=CAMNT_0043312051 /DNA_START=136 /DNA_END=1290 /DNA_ORIENTATION=+
MRPTNRSHVVASLLSAILVIVSFKGEFKYVAWCLEIEDNADECTTDTCFSDDTPYSTLRDYALYHASKHQQAAPNAETEKNLGCGVPTSEDLIARCREIKTSNDFKHSFLFHSESHEPISISSLPMKYGKIGARIWPSGVALSLYLVGTGAASGMRLLELASGLGLPSSVAMNIGGAADVLATDFWMDLPHKSANIEALTKEAALGRQKTWTVPTKEFGENLKANIGIDRVRKLDYHNETECTSIISAPARGNDNHGPNLIIGSDLIYFEADNEPIIQCIRSLMHPSGQRVLLVSPLPSTDGRGSLGSFIAKVRKWSNEEPDIEFQSMEVALCCNGHQCESPNENSFTCHAVGSKGGEYIIIDITKKKAKGEGKAAYAHARVAK